MGKLYLMISILFLIPLTALVLLPLVPHSRVNDFTLATTVIAFLFSVYMSLLIDSSSTFQFITTYSVFNTSFTFGIDGISMAFILLTAFILPICVMVSREAIKMEVKQFYFCLLSIELLLFAVFSVLDILGFYVVYEAILIPMVLIIGV